MSLKGRVALVTGASRSIGIGAAICRALAVQGADVFFTHWRAYDQTMVRGADEDAPHLLQTELRALGVRCEHMEADLSQPETPAKVMDTAESQMGSVLVLVNNAAYSTLDDYSTLTAVSLDAHYAVNVRGAFLISVEFVRRFKAKSGGRIINMTSGQSLGPMPGELAYAATKGAVEAFTVSLAAGVSKLGITVNAVNPGPTDTGWMDDVTRTYVLSRSPRGRIGQPEDAARLVAFLAGDGAEWITGQVIHSEGGFRGG